MRFIVSCSLAEWHLTVDPLRGLRFIVSCSLAEWHLTVDPLRGTRREVNSLRPLRGRPGLRPAGLATVSGDVLASILAAIFGNAPASTLAVSGCSGLGQHISTIFGLALGSTLAASFSYGVASGHFVIAYFCFVVSYGVASGRHVIAYFCFVVAGGVASGRHVIAYFCFVVAGGVASGRHGLRIFVSWSLAEWRLAVGQGVPEGGEVGNPTARTPQGCVAWGIRDPSLISSPEGGQQHPPRPSFHY